MNRLPSLPPGKQLRLPVLIAAATLAMAQTGCVVRVGPEAAPHAAHEKSRGRSGHFSEGEALGAVEEQPITESSIGAALDAKASLRLPRNSPVLVIQSGSSAPSKAFLDPLAGRMRAAGHTGVKQDLGSDQPVSMLIRMAAARKQATHVVILWERLESSETGLLTELVSWVPVVDILVPDKYERLRLRLNVGILDVRSGLSTTFEVGPEELKGLTTRFARTTESIPGFAEMRARLHARAAEQLAASHLD